MKLKALYIFFFIAVIAGCKSTKETTQVRNLPEITVSVPASHQKIYRASNTKSSDLVHTKLMVSFDWAKRYLYGKATITLKPHFYPVNYVYLNARGMEIGNVMLVTKNGNQKTNYHYGNDSLQIFLDREYSRDENYTVWIEYVAKPDELVEGGSAAIRSDKGLYFINPDGSDPDKPKQIWTQGETQSNSVWFPTIDSPNQRMTQEIYITIDTAYKTLSNGLLIYFSDNKNGTRTDYWKQSLSAAPYLTMMAIGKYSIVKDKWRNLDVNYYVEPEYEKYAKMIFGHTPEMLEFYSTKLGVDFVWEKFSQVVARDYVSGAMENASAVLHGEFIQQDDREYLDQTYEDVISHELFHQWFGDLVTCESWSNIPLNESFATYAEYLWNEHKYGRAMADNGLLTDMLQYFREAAHKQVNLIRFDYEQREDMFDRHSYQKGGCVLHMLRKYVGDEAFWASLHEYLIENKFSSVEIHNLRLAFEKVTGEDLNWFFNQWFLDKGHPEIEISYDYNDSLKKEKVIIEQKQDLSSTPLYKIPLDVDIYENGKAKRQRITITDARQEFVFNVSSKPDLVNVDAEKMLLCKKTDNKSLAEFIYQYKNAPLYFDKYEALQKVGSSYAADSEAGTLMEDALNNAFPGIRILAIKNIAPLAKHKQEEIKTKLIQLARSDEKSSVRSEAIKALSKYFKDEDLKTLYREKTNDRSYDVASEALVSLTVLSPDEGLKLSSELENDSSSYILAVVANVYAEYGGRKQNDFFVRTYPKVKPAYRYEFIMQYGAYLRKADLDIVSDGVKFIIDKARNAEPWHLRLVAMQSLTSLEESLKTKSEKLATSENKQDAEEAKKIADTLHAAIADIKKNERNQQLKKIYDLRN
jgi:aminopeptidase N